MSAYFIAHDNEITPKQADYLANCSMQVLLTAESVVVHKVAADRFKAARTQKGSEYAEAENVSEKRQKHIEV